MLTAQHSLLKLFNYCTNNGYILVFPIFPYIRMQISSQVLCCYFQPVQVRHGAWDVPLSVRAVPTSRRAAQSPDVQSATRAGPALTAHRTSTNAPYLQWQCANPAPLVSTYPDLVPVSTRTVHRPFACVSYHINKSRYFRNY